jgi:hypothetical protein
MTTRTLASALRWLSLLAALAPRAAALDMVVRPLGAVPAPAPGDGRCGLASHVAARRGKAIDPGTAGGLAAEARAIRDAWGG